MSVAPLPTAATEDRRRIPTPVAIACALLILDAILAVLSVYGLGHLKGWGSPNHLVAWFPAVVIVPVAILVGRGVGWLRYAVLAWVVYAPVDTVLHSNIPMRYQTSPEATLRDGLTYALEAAAAILLFVPTASGWFGRKGLGRRA